jgi:hypothetical protein
LSRFVLNGEQTAADKEEKTTEYYINNTWVCG